MDYLPRLTEIFLQLNGKTFPNAVQKSDFDIMARADAGSLALAQQKALDAGVKADDLWQLWVQNRNLLPDQAAKLKSELPPNHILQRVLAEHEMVLCFIADLDEVDAHIQTLDSASSTSLHIRKLAHIAWHLVASEEHRSREEEVIFPQLVLHGYASLLKVVHDQHVLISQRNRKLKELVYGVDGTDFGYFKYQVSDLTRFLVRNCRLHIFIETNIVFPLALAVIKDPAVWQRVKDLSDELGYCGYHVL